MESIAKALLVSMSYLELWDDDTIDPDLAIGALEAISAELEKATPEEVKVIAKVAQELADSAEDEATREFYANFVEDFGFDD